MKYFESFKDAYKYKPYFLGLALKKLNNKNESEDKVEDMYVKVLEFKNQNPNKKLSSFVMEKILNKICYRENKNEKVFK